MSRRGFTLIELMIALSISGIIMTAIFMMLAGIWTLAKESSDELQGALQARAIRERLYYSLLQTTDKKTGVVSSYGLISATNILVSASELVAQFPNGKNTSVKAKKKPYYLDSSTSRKYRAADKALQSIFISFKTSSNVTFLDRVVVPVFGRHPATAESAGEKDEIIECFYK